MSEYNPFSNPAPRVHLDGPYLREEVALANRNHGMLAEMLRYDVTPAGLHYLLNHFDVPYVPDPAAWMLDVGGAVSRPFGLSMSELKALPQKTMRVTLECAGSGRAHVVPRWPSMPWMGDAVGTAEWTGTPLRGLLERAGLSKDAKEIAFIGADCGFDKGQEHAYGRSLTVAHALDPDVLVVTGMNGQPLLPQHGLPVRLVVPGWYGMASVKWLKQIVVLTEPYDGFQQVQTYMYRAKPEAAGVPVTVMRVRSMMVPPGIPDWYSRRRLVEAGLVKLHGRAWSGGGVPISRVEVRVGSDWQAARLLPNDNHRYAWTAWEFDWTAHVGEHILACRATDANGVTQPIEPAFDRGGFGANGVHCIEVTVR